MKWQQYSRLRLWLARKAAKFFIVFCHLYISWNSCVIPTDNFALCWCRISGHDGYDGMTMTYKDDRTPRMAKRPLPKRSKKQNDSIGDVQTYCMLVPDLVWREDTCFCFDQRNRIWNMLHLCFGSLISVHLKHTWIASERTYKISD